MYGPPWTPRRGVQSRWLVGDLVFSRLSSHLKRERVEILCNEPFRGGHLPFPEVVNPPVTFFITGWDDNAPGLPSH